MNSYYTTISTAQELAKRMIGVTGTIKKNSKNLPDSLKKNKKMKKGEFVCMRSGNILGLVWKDRNHVRMISNIDGISKIRDHPEMVPNYKVFIWNRSG